MNSESCAISAVFLQLPHLMVTFLIAASLSAPERLLGIGG